MQYERKFATEQELLFSTIFEGWIALVAADDPGDRILSWLRRGAPKSSPGKLAVV